MAFCWLQPKLVLQTQMSFFPLMGFWNIFRLILAQQKTWLLLTTVAPLQIIIVDNCMPLQVQKDRH